MPAPPSRHFSPKRSSLAGLAFVAGLICLVAVFSVVRRQEAQQPRRKESRAGRPAVAAQLPLTTSR